MTTYQQIQGFIDDFALSEKLTGAQVASLISATTDNGLIALTFTAPTGDTNKGTATGANSVSIPLWNIPADVKSFDEGLTFDEIDRTSVNSKVKKYRRGRGDWELNSVMYESVGDGTKYKFSGDLISAVVNDDDDVRLLYAKRETGSQELWALVSITEASSSTGEDSDLTKSVKFRLASGAKIPIWE